VYWQTHESNAVARRLYDDVATFEGYVVYTLPVGEALTVGAGTVGGR
jgi:hypothetical protein